ncbi:hypothetical protein Barb7_00678 [Bacteroidales bacterium Barb7]|nr:hypothetical protein Barb7_00678 [Bacteroidales bacterium Barb7]
MSSSEGKLGSKPGAFGGNRFFGNLHQHFLTRFEHIVNAPLFSCLRQNRPLGKNGEFLRVVAQCLFKELLLGVEART